MNTWGNGWRKLVTWDKVNKQYLYKDSTILPLSYSEQISMPLHLQNEYYWDEITRIDNICNLQTNLKDNNENDVQKAFDEWWQLVES